MTRGSSRGTSLPAHIALLVLAAAQPVFYQLQLERPDGVKGRIFLNGAAVFTFEDQGMANAALNLWLKPEGNSLEIQLERSKKPLEKDAKVSASVVHMTRSEPDAEATSATLAWAEADGLPKTIKARFDAKDAPRHLLWDKAEAATFDDAAKTEITQLLKGLSAAMAKRDVPEIKKRLLFRTEDTARAIGDTPEESNSMIEERFKAFPAGAKPANPVLEFEPMAEGKLISVTGARGAKAVQVVKQGRPVMAFDVTVARVDGAWRIVR